MVAFLLLLFWSIAGVRQGSLKILWSPLYLPAGLFFLLGMIQFAGRLTMDPIATREALLKLSTDLIFFFLAGQLFCAPASGADSSRKWDKGRPHGGGVGSDILSASPCVGPSSCTPFCWRFLPSSNSFRATG